MDPAGELAYPNEPERPIWHVLEAESTGRTVDDAAHWVGVYGNLVALLDKGAAVRIGDGSGGELMRVRLEEVRARLDYWRARLDAEAAG